MKRHKHYTIWVYIQREVALLGPLNGLDDVSQYILHFYKLCPNHIACRGLVKILIDCLTSDDL
jgi:hypothetical protein